MDQPIALCRPVRGGEFCAAAWHGANDECLDVRAPLPSRVLLEIPELLSVFMEPPHEALLAILEGEHLRLVIGEAIPSCWLQLDRLDACGTHGI